MPTVYSITAHGYGGEAMTPGNGIVSRECTFLFMSSAEAEAFADRNRNVYHSISRPRITVISNLDFARLLQTTKPSIRGRLLETHVS